MSVRASGLWGKPEPAVCRGARRLRRFVRSRMPVRSSRPMRLLGWVSRICLAMVWLVLSLNRLSRAPMAIRRRVAKPRAFTLEPFLQTRVVVSFGSSPRASCVKLAVVLGGRDGGQIPLAQVDAYH